MIKNLYKYKKDIIRITIAIICIILSYININLWTIDPIYITLILCAIPIIYNSCIGLIKDHDIKADLLVSLAIIASVYIGEVFAAAEIAVIMEIGGLLEEITVSTTQNRIENLMKLQPTKARLIKNNTETLIDALEIKKDDIIKINPGETIAADGKIIKGSTTVNQSIITGESLPVDKSIDDEVYAGTINNYGQITIKATTNAKDNSLQKLITLIENVNNEETPIIREADQLANIVVAISLTLAIYTYFVTQSITNAVTILVVFCPCALVLATPTAIIATIGNLSKHGILVKNASVIEAIHKTDNILFDKTGTITTGTPKVVNIKTHENTQTDKLLKITASAEKNYEHPIAQAIINYYDKEDILEAKDFEVEMGMGISCRINDKECLIGSEKLFTKHNIDIPDNLYQNNETSTIIYSYYDNKFLGTFSIKDTPKNGIKDMIKRLQKDKYDITLLTGDNENVAKDIAKQVNITSIKSNCLPEDKLKYVNKLRRKYRKVMMVGDGINDAIALKKADTGVAMGSIGSDISIESADLVLINDDIRYIPHVLRMSKRTHKTIRYGIIFSLVLNTAAMLLAMMGLLTPITGALVHNIGSVIVIILAAMLFKIKPEIKSY